MRNGLWLFILIGLVLAPTSARADEDHCDLCGKAYALSGNPPTFHYYTFVDKVTRKKLMICHDCASIPDECSICGLPVRTNFFRLPDGRFLCQRDARTAVLSDDEARNICFETIDNLNRMLSRFLTLPTTNVEFRLADRVDLYDQFIVVGDNFEAPNVLGYTMPCTNRDMDHAVFLMVGLPRAEFQATCAHEFAHTWVFENVSKARLKTLHRDAHEGFCELIAYLLMDSLHEEDQKKIILQNAYTRGQIDLFIAAEKQYGINDVLDWVRWGVNSKLRAENLEDIRNVEIPRARFAATNTVILAAQRAPAPDRLSLKGIFSMKGHPLALINDQTLGIGETATVRVATSNVLVRCLAIGNRSAEVQLVNSGKRLELFLPERK